MVFFRTKMRSLPKLLILIFLIGLADGSTKMTLVSNAELPPSIKGNKQPSGNAFKIQNSNAQVKGQGTVIKILADDQDGSRHQRFIIKLSSGKTLLVAHNIDLAPRINSLQKGDLVIFKGEYEWNAQGGVIHWTHHDPAGNHPGGWIEHNGKKYE